VYKAQLLFLLQTVCVFQHRQTEAVNECVRVCLWLFFTHTSRTPAVSHNALQHGSCDHKKRIYLRKSCQEHTHTHTHTHAHTLWRMKHVWCCVKYDVVWSVYDDV